MTAGGSNAERSGECGLARLTQQMLLQGTKSKGALAIAREIDELGGTVTGRTASRGALLVGLVEHRQWEQAIELLTDLVNNPRFDADALELEKRAMAAEAEHWRRPTAGRARRMLLAAIWPERHEYADGVGEIGRYTVADVRRFFERTYAADQRVAGAVGAVDSEDLAKFAGNSSGSSARTEARAIPCPEPAWHTVSLYEAAELGQSHVCLALPAPMAGDAAFQALHEVLGGGVGSRLQAKLAGRQPVRQIRSAIQSDGAGKAWLIEASITPGGEAEGVHAILSELRAVGGSDPVRDEELWMAQESGAAWARQVAANPLAELERLLQARLTGEPPMDGKYDQTGLAQVRQAAKICIEPWLPQVSVACIGPARGTSPVAQLHHIVDAHRQVIGRQSLNGSH
ncbi:MAG: insulinase family protein [Bryobacteraceae bacterium]